MSIKLMSQVWENSDLAGTPLLLLLSLADYANDDGLCWPSIPQLARRIRTSERQCQRLMASLIARNEVEMVDRSLGGRGYTSIYRVKPRTTNGDIQIINGDISGVNGDISDTTNGDIQRVNGDISGTNGDISVTTNGDIQRANGDIQRANGDIAVSPDPPIDPPIDPPLTPTPLRGGGGGGVQPQTVIAAPGRRTTDLAFGEICTRYESNFGLLGESLLRQISELLEEFPQPLILAAMDTAVANEKRNLAYVRGVLRNNGSQYAKKGNGNGERRDSSGKTKTAILSPSAGQRDPNAGYDHDWAMQYLAQDALPPL